MGILATKIEINQLTAFLNRYQVPIGSRDMYLRREMLQLLMDLDFDPLFQCWGEFYF